MQIRNIIIYYNYMENENVHKYIYNVNELYEKNVIDCYFYVSSTIITNNIDNIMVKLTIFNLNYNRNSNRKMNLNKIHLNN